MRARGARTARPHGWEAARARPLPPASPCTPDAGSTSAARDARGARAQGTIVGQLNQRKGNVANVETHEGGNVVVEAHVPLDDMFGYSTDLRSVTQGKGEFSMEYYRHMATSRDKQEELVAKYQEKLAAKKK